jgi:hypothetical protein
VAVTVNTQGMVPERDRDRTVTVSESAARADESLAVARPTVTARRGPAAGRGGRRGRTPPVKSSSRPLRPGRAARARRRLRLGARACQ